MYELIYTSVPKGLIPGRSGFATVAMSEGMPPNLIVPLENLSGYNFTLRDSTFLPVLNPPCCYYIKMRYGNSQLHIAGRVAPNGLDYSQRNNKIAHHLLFESAEELENLSGGVAGLFLKPGVFRSEYTEEPAMLPFRKVPVCLQMGSLPARTWAELAGHAGFAAYAAERFRENQDKPLYLIYPAGTPTDKLLDLVMEVCAVLGEKLRNYLTFSTYFGSSTASVDCFLRMVPDFSPLVPNLRRFHKNDVIELGEENDLPEAELNSPLYEYACTGIRPMMPRDNQDQPLTQHTIRILADSGLPPEPVREMLNDTPEFTVPPPEPPVSYRKFVFAAVGVIIIAAIASLLLHDIPDKTRNTDDSVKKKAVEFNSNPAAKPITSSNAAATAAPEKSPAPEAEKPAAVPAEAKPAAAEVVVPQAPKVPAVKKPAAPRGDIFKTPLLRKKAVFLPPAAALKLFIKLNSLKNNNAQIKIELPGELHKTQLIYPVMERIGTGKIDNDRFVEKGKNPGEVYIRSAQSGSLPLQPVRGDIEEVSHLQIKLSADKKFMIITAYNSGQMDCIMPEISKIKQIYFQLPDKVYLWKNSFSTKYISLIKPGRLEISGNDLPQYTPTAAEEAIKPFAARKFGKCSEATFLSGSFYLADWNNDVNQYFQTLKNNSALKRQLKVKATFTGEPREYKSMQKKMEDLQKTANDGDIKTVNTIFTEFLGKFFNSQEKIHMTSTELKNISEKFASALAAPQTEKEKRKKIYSIKNKWDEKIKAIELFHQLRKNIDESDKKLISSRQKMAGTASRMLTAAKNIDQDIEKLMQGLMKDAKAPSWQITPSLITAEETIVLRNAILKKINYEKITIDPDGE